MQAKLAKSAFFVSHPMANEKKKGMFIVVTALDLNFMGGGL